MQKERPVRPEDAESFADQLRDAFGSAENQLTAVFAGNKLRLERVSTTEFHLWAPGAPIPARVVLSTDPEATEYPADVPHLPGEIVMLASAGAKLTATWWSRTDPGELLAEIDRQTVASGWDTQPEQSIAGTSNTRRTYRKHGVLRSVMSGQGIVSLNQQPTG
jgi:hypothetical protein